MHIPDARPEYADSANTAGARTSLGLCRLQYGEWNTALDARRGVGSAPSAWIARVAIDVVVDRARARESERARDAVAVAGARGRRCARAGAGARADDERR